MPGENRHAIFGMMGWVGRACHGLQNLACDFDDNPEIDDPAATSEDPDGFKNAGLRFQGLIPGEGVFVDIFSQ
jgi:hypothetical protein